jgi:hypothetical protein
MAYQRYSPAGDKHYIADAVADLADLPIGSMGDTCSVIENGGLYTRNSKNEWIRTDIPMASVEQEAIDMSGYVTTDMLAKAIEEANHVKTDALTNYVTSEALAAMPFAKIMRENGEHKIALGPKNDMALVDKMDELGPGLYTIYMERSCQDIPEGAREIDSSCRGIFFVDTYKIAEQKSEHFYGWALLFDHDGNVYSKYVRRSVASDWKKLS